MGERQKQGLISSAVSAGHIQLFFCYFALGTLLRNNEKKISALKELTD